MPGKVLKDLYLFRNTDELQIAVGDPAEKTLLGYKKILCSAVKCADEARLAETDGDEERAYILYSRAVCTFQQSRKARDFEQKRDQHHWQEMGGKQMMTALQKAESLFSSLQRRYGLRDAVEEADRVEALVTSSRMDPSTSKLSQRSSSVTRDSTPDNGGDSGSSTDKSLIENAITPYDLYQEIQKVPAPVLILDTRDHEAFEKCHIKASHCINVPLKNMANCYTAGQFENHLPIADRTHFRKRHNYQYIVLVDNRSDDVEKAFHPGNPLRVLSAALYEFDNRPTQRPPRLLVGGFESWHLKFPSWTTNPSNYQPPSPDYDLSGFGDVSSVINDSWAYPDFEKFLIDQIVPPEPTPATPSIPDRTKKPAFIKSAANNGGGSVDMGDYVQLDLPESLKTNAFDQNSAINSITVDEETQKVFDGAVSKHIDMRDQLESMKERFRSVAIGDDDTVEPKNQSEDLDRIGQLLTSLEEKEKEINRMQEVQRLRRLKPTLETVQARRDAEEARAKIASLENEVELLARQLETKERERMDAEARSRLAMVERLRQERKMRESNLAGKPDAPKSIDEEGRLPTGVPGGAKEKIEPEPDGIGSEGNMRRSQSTPYLNRTPEEEEPPITPAFQPAAAMEQPKPQIPDRSKKPIEKEWDVDRMVRLELEFYSTNIRRIQGPEGRVTSGLTGLKNLGNTCYMNSTIQCLSNIPPFVDYFVRGYYRRSINYVSVLGSKGEVARNFAVLLGAIWEGRFKYVIPTQFKHCISKVAPVFAGYDQQDAQEFLAFLLDGLHEDLNQVKERRSIPEQNNDRLSDEEAAHRAWVNHQRIHSSFIVNMFQGQYLSVVKCRVCQRESRTFDVFMYLSLPIPSDRKCRLEDCLLRYLAPEEMTGDCKWHCSYCNRKRDAVKKISIWRLPKILLIHLNRFSNNGQWREKLQTNVDFPVTRLDMSDYCVPGSTYTLIGVSNHYGTMEGGHYTAYCKNTYSDRWYKFDDHEVSPISQGSVKTSAAYILYYIADDYSIELQR